MRLSLKEQITVETEDGRKKHLQVGDVIEFNPREVVDYHTAGETICPIMSQYDEVWFIDTIYMYNLLPRHLRGA